MPRENDVAVWSAMCCTKSSNDITRSCTHAHTTCPDTENCDACPDTICTSKFLSYSSFLLPFNCFKSFVFLLLTLSACRLALLMQRYNISLTQSAVRATYVDLWRLKANYDSFGRFMGTYHPSTTLPPSGNNAPLQWKPCFLQVERMQEGILTLCSMNRYGTVNLALQHTSRCLQ